MRCTTENDYVYVWKPAGTVPNVCPRDDTHVIDPVHTVVLESVGQNKHTQPIQEQRVRAQSSSVSTPVYTEIARVNVPNSRRTRPVGVSVTLDADWYPGTVSTCDVRVLDMTTGSTLAESTSVDCSDPNAAEIVVTLPLSHESITFSGDNIQLSCQIRALYNGSGGVTGAGSLRIIMVDYAV